MSNKAVCVLAFISGVKPEQIVEVVRQSEDAMDSNASMWLWIRGQYESGSLSWDHWKVASALKKDGWLVRNEIAWACKVSDPAPENRLKRGYEKLLFLVRGQDYHYDRTMGFGRNEKPARNKKGKVITRSGVVGAKYASQIENSPFMSVEEKASALESLKLASDSMSKGEISDFRMVLRGFHKATRSVAEKVDKEGFYIRTTKSHSPLLDDFWTSYSSETNSSMPEDILLSILRLSCPIGYSVLDLFPSTEVAKTVVEAGRVYIAKGINGVGYVNSVLEQDLFTVEEKQNEPIEEKTLEVTTEERKTAEIPSS